MVSPNQIVLGIVISTMIILFIVLLLLYFISLYNKKILQKEKDYQAAMLMKEADSLRTLVESQENEKNRIAKNLHDDVEPMLSLIKINLSSIASRKPEQVPELVTKQMNLITTVIDQIKSTCYDLSPSFLIKFGLEAALQEFGNNFDSSNPLRLTGFEKYENLPQNTTIALYRMLTEIMNNALKYGEGAEFELAFDKVSDGYIFDFKYVGKGLSQQEFLEKAEASTSLGLKNILERSILIKSVVNYYKNGRFVGVTIKTPLTHE